MINNLIEQAWERRKALKAGKDVEVEQAVSQVLDALDQGRIRVAEKIDGSWHLNTWVKKAILLAFRLNKNQTFATQSPAYDKVPLKFANWDEEAFIQSKIRAAPGNYVRHGAFVATDVVLMPSFVNIGAYVDQGTMIDSWATIGSCAQIGKYCHISAGVSIGGVLEPVQANPVIIEDDCFIGAGCQIVEGVTIEEGAVIGMGVSLGASTPIVNRATGETTYGLIPKYALVVAGSLPMKKVSGGANLPSLPCAVILKHVDKKTKKKMSINELLRI